MLKHCIVLAGAVEDAEDATAILGRTPHKPGLRPGNCQMFLMVNTSTAKHFGHYELLLPLAYVLLWRTINTQPWRTINTGFLTQLWRTMRAKQYSVERASDSHGHGHLWSFKLCKTAKTKCLERCRFDLPFVWVMCAWTSAPRLIPLWRD